MQAIVLAGIPVLAGWGAFLWTAPSLDAPFEPRVIHPQPPGVFTFRGRQVELAGLINPLCTDAGQLAAGIAEGKRIYYRNYFFCHGDTLAGDGPFASTFSPRPANFRDVGTITMLQESFVFWRVSTGGPGLPKGGDALELGHARLVGLPVQGRGVASDPLHLRRLRAPPREAGRRPFMRATDLCRIATMVLVLLPLAGPAAAEMTMEPAGMAPILADPALGRQLYEDRCAQCHGMEGKG